MKHDEIVTALEKTDAAIADLAKNVSDAVVTLFQDHIAKEDVMLANLQSTIEKQIESLEDFRVSIISAREAMKPPKDEKSEQSTQN